MLLTLLQRRSICIALRPAGLPFPPVIGSVRLARPAGSVHARCSNNSGSSVDGNAWSVYRNGSSAAAPKRRRRIVISSSEASAGESSSSSSDSGDLTQGGVRQLNRQAHRPQRRRVVASP